MTYMHTSKPIKSGRFNRVMTQNLSPKGKFDQIKGVAAGGNVNIFLKIDCLCAIGPNRICVDMFDLNILFL